MVEKTSPVGELLKESYKIGIVYLYGELVKMKIWQFSWWPWESKVKESGLLETSCPLWGGGAGGGNFFVWVFLCESSIE